MARWFGDGVVDLGRRLGDRFPTLRAVIAGGALDTGYRTVAGHAVAADHRPGQDHLRWTQLPRPCCRGGRPTTGEPAGLFEAGQHPGRWLSGLVGFAVW